MRTGCRHEKRRQLRKSGRAPMRREPPGWALAARYPVTRMLSSAGWRLPDHDGMARKMGATGKEVASERYPGQQQGGTPWSSRSSSACPLFDRRTITGPGKGDFKRLEYALRIPASAHEPEGNQRIRQRQIGDAGSRTQAETHGLGPVPFHGTRAGLG